MIFNKLFVLAALATSIVAHPETGAGNKGAFEIIKEREPVEYDDVSPRDEPSSLVARACDYSVGCTSEVGASAGKYCGFCKQVHGNWNGNYIYQVNGKSGSKSCCSYGYSTSCANRWKVVQPDFLVNCKNTDKGY